MGRQGWSPAEVADGQTGGGSLEMFGSLLVEVV